MKSILHTHTFRYLLRFLPALLMMILIFVHSAMPADVSSQESFLLEELVRRLLGTDPDTASFLVRKCAHLLEYTVLGFCLAFFADRRPVLSVTSLPPAEKEEYQEQQRPAPEKTEGSFRKWFVSRGLPVWVGGVFYAVTDEIHQMFVPGRSCELRDLGIDAAGVMTGVVIYCLILRIRNRHRSDREF